MQRNVSQLDADLQQVIEGTGASPAIQAEIARITAQLRKVGPVLAADVKQLRELVLLMMRCEALDDLLKGAISAGDAKVYISLTKERSAQAMLLRALLKDLRLTRSSTPVTAESADARKAQQRAGSAWEGVL